MNKFFFILTLKLINDLISDKKIILIRYYIFLLCLKRLKNYESNILKYSIFNFFFNKIFFLVFNFY